MLDQNQKNMDVLILELVMLLIAVHTWNENVFHGRKRTTVMSFRKIPKCVLLSDLT